MILDRNVSGSKKKKSSPSNLRLQYQAFLAPKNHD